MLSPHVPDLRGLELLVVVSRTESLTAAAAELGISQQAASARLRTMEAMVGAPLLARSRRGSALTQNGELVVQWASRVLAAAEQLDAGITALRAGRRGRLALAASLTIAEYLLPGWMVGVRAQQQGLGMPATDFTMTAANSEQVVALVASGAVDLGFVEGPDTPDGLQHRLVGVDQLVVVVGPTHPWALRPSRRVMPTTLATTPFVARETGSGTRTVLERALGEVSMVEPVLELSSTAAVRAAVAAGAGPAALSVHAVRDDIAAGRLVPITVTGLDLTRRLHALWTGSSELPAGPVRDLVRFAERS